MQSSCNYVFARLTDLVMRGVAKILPALVAAVSLSGCGEGDNRIPGEGDDPGEAAIRVLVSVPPQADFVRRIGGEHVRVDVLVGDGQDPHTFSPTPAQMRTLGRAQIYFTVGMPFEEPIVTKIAGSGRGITVVDTATDIEKIAQQCDHSDHDHADHGHGHGHQDDPHIWLAPELIKFQADRIAAALTAADPVHADAFAANLSSFGSELDTLHAELTEATRPYIGEKFFVFHPAFGYFAHAYGIDQVAIEIGGNNPTPKELAAFLATARDEGIKVLFVQPQFDSRSAEVVAKSLGAKVVALDPLAGDVLPNLRRIAAAIVDGLAD